MRLVDADALIDNICRYASPEMAWDRIDIVHKINEMPTIEERKTGRAVYQAGYAEGYKAAQLECKTGKWVEVHGFCTPGGDPVWACSECGKGIHVYGIEYGTYGADIADGQWKACPNCGAKMEGVQP